MKLRSSRKILVFLIGSLLLLDGLGRAAPSGPAPAPRDGKPRFQKVMIVIFENTDYEGALAQPFFGRLAKEGALLTRYYAVRHPSQPNYIALAAGDTHGVRNDANVTLDARHIGDLLEAKKKNWKVYAEGYPGGCFLGAVSSTYVRKHTPFLSFKNVQADPARCARVVDASALDQDIRLGALPDYSMYIPDLKNDGHNTDVAYADRWFAGAFGPKLQNPDFMKDLLLVATFDEAENRGGDNHIYTALYGPAVQAGSSSAERYTHYDLLRTIEGAFGLGTLGLNDQSARPIAGIWK